MIDRRAFLRRTGLAAAGLSLAACAEQESTAQGGPRGSWEWVRDQFDLSPDVVHMGALLISSHPRAVREAIDGYRHELNANPVTYLDNENDRRTDAVRQAAASYAGGSADNIALTDSTTMGIGMVYNGLRLQPGDEILTTEHDYYATHEALRTAAERTGATVKKIPLYDQIDSVTEDEIVTRISQAVTPRTRAVALTWVHSSTGLKIPVRAIADALEGEDALLCIDGVHGFGVEDETPADLGCDFFMAGCHKWLFGPRGTGIVWGRSGAWQALRPIIPSFIDGGAWSAWARGREPGGPVTAERMTPGGFKPFEHVWAMADAFEFHQEIGRGRIAERTDALAGRLKEELARMPGVQLITPRDQALSAGIVCFDVGGQEAEDVVRRLKDRNVVATTTPYIPSHPRLTPCIYNSEDDISRVIEALREVA